MPFGKRFFNSRSSSSRPFKSKKGIELSVNFMVILIIGIVLFGGGVALMYKVFNATTKLKDTLDSQTQDRINELLSNGQRVVVPDSAQEVQRGKLVTFGLGIANELQGPEIFSIEITPNAAFDAKQAPISNILWSKVKILYSGDNNGAGYKLDRNSHIAIPFGFAPDSDATAGTYIFNVVVNKADGSQYDFTQKVYVTVK